MEEVGHFLQMGKIMENLSHISGKYGLVCVRARVCVCGIKLFLSEFLPDNFIPSGVNVVNTAEVVLLNIGF
jgi:hypothetical protein